MTDQPYILSLNNDLDDDLIHRVFSLTWRHDFSAPGFCVLNAGEHVDTHQLRRAMIDLKNGLSDLHRQHRGVPFCFRSMGRFDQQETTKFHLDGAPERSLLILGYEPSRVVSRLYMADYTRAAFDMGITPKQFLSDYNPMFGKNEERLAGYITEVPAPVAGNSRIIVINNSSLTYSANGDNPLGVMHKAIIVTPTASERRIVNSTMLDLEGNDLAVEKQNEFVATEGISEKFF